MPDQGPLKVAREGDDQAICLPVKKDPNPVSHEMIDSLCFTCFYWLKLLLSSSFFFISLLPCSLFFIFLFLLLFFLLLFFVASCSAYFVLFFSFFLRRHLVLSSSCFLLLLLFTSLLTFSFWFLILFPTIPLLCFPLHIYCYVDQSKNVSF